MAKDKKSFILYSDLLDKIEMLTIEERGILFTHLLEYVNDKEPVLTDRLLLAAWKPIELELKRDLKKYEAAKESKANGGRLGNLKRWNLDLYEDVINKNITLDEAEIIAISRKKSHTDKEVSHTDINLSHTIASVAVNDNVNVNVNDNVNVNVNVNDINKINYNNTLISKNEAFNVFWDLYGKKQDKAKCEQKFLKLSKKEIENILLVVKDYVISTPEVKYRKNPLTWLNGKCWEDEIIQTNDSVINKPIEELTVDEKLALMRKPYS